MAYYIKISSFVISFLMFLSPQMVHAWSCVPPTYKIHEKLQAAEKIFVARVKKAWVQEDTFTVASVTAEGGGLKEHKYFRYFAEYELIKQVRGRPSATGILEAAQEPFKVELVPGHVYLVLLQDSNQTGSCEGTVRLHDWDAEQLEIGEASLEGMLKAYASWPREVLEAPE